MSEIQDYLQKAIESIENQDYKKIENLEAQITELQEGQKDLEESLEILASSFDELKNTYQNLADTLEKNLL